MLEGIVAVYKPKGITSHDVIARIRRLTGVKRVGHAGTLDPLATGVLVIGIGREATKKLGVVVGKEKEYIATIKLGFSSTTDDEEGIKISNIKNQKSNSAQEVQAPSLGEIKIALKQFVGHIKQTPPQYSAVKIKGKPAYKSARKGKKVELKEREVFIREIELLDYVYPLLKIKVTTGPGVYIRSLARDLGEKLSIGAYVSELERSRVGEFMKKDALILQDIEKTL